MKLDFNLIPEPNFTNVIYDLTSKASPLDSDPLNGILNMYVSNRDIFSENRLKLAYGKTILKFRLTSETVLVNLDLAPLEITGDLV